MVRAQPSRITQGQGNQPSAAKPSHGPIPSSRVRYPWPVRGLDVAASHPSPVPMGARQTSKASIEFWQAKLRRAWVMSVPQLPSLVILGLESDPDDPIECL